MSKVDKKEIRNIDRLLFLAWALWLVHTLIIIIAPEIINHGSSTDIFINGMATGMLLTTTLVWLAIKFKVKRLDPKIDLDGDLHMVEEDE